MIPDLSNKVKANNKCQDDMTALIEVMQKYGEFIRRINAFNNKLLPEVERGIDKLIKQ